MTERHEANSTDEIEITAAMIEAGEDAVHSLAAECASPYYSPADLAIAVYRAMAFVNLRERDLDRRSILIALRVQTRRPLLLAEIVVQESEPSKTERFGIAV